MSLFSLDLTDQQVTDFRTFVAGIAPINRMLRSFLDEAGVL